MQRTRISEADKISRLPDDILGHILSFLTTKKAVRTSILSKRWTHLWQSCHTIHFTDIQVHCIRSNRRFNKSVESVLCTPDSRSINTFRLQVLYGHPHFAYKLSFPKVVKWVNIVVQRQLRNLCLHLDVDEYDHEDGNEDAHFLPKLPTSIFTCNTLVTLDLRRFCVKDFSFSSSDGFGFPSLKTLHLVDIEFSLGRDFLLLLSGCPILENLKLFHVYLECWMNESAILEEFKNLCLPKLTTTDIIESLWHILPLKALSTSKSLCLDTLQFHEPFKVNQAFDGIPIFHNLTHLKLTNSWDLVVQVLHHCPKLQNIELYEAMYVRREDEDYDQVELDLVPQCLLSHLRTCTIHDLGCLQRDLVLPMYILKNARVLQTMKVTIWYQREQSKQSEQSKIERKLSLCPKASATCQLFVHA